MGGGVDPLASTENFFELKIKVVLNAVCRREGGEAWWSMPA
jgi:hypothetical protein